MLKKLACATVMMSFLVGAVSIELGFADKDESALDNQGRRGGHRGREGGRERGEPFPGNRGRGGEGSALFPAITNQAYKQECSTCHFAYQPGLLPARSWQTLAKNTDNHFGEEIVLKSNTRSEIVDYLVANSADTATSNVWSRMIMASLNADQTPERITEVPFIQERHRKIGLAVFKKKTVESFSNCDACHTTAAEGDYGEDSVRFRR